MITRGDSEKFTREGFALSVRCVFRLDPGRVDVKTFPEVHRDEGKPRGLPVSSPLVSVTVESRGRFGVFTPMSNSDCVLHSP